MSRLLARRNLHPLCTGKRKVYWHNMREEPVIYVNGRPYVVREADAPLSNLEYTGITRARVEAMEARLKQDVVQEAAKYESHILLAHEGDDFQLIEIWEPTTEYDVQTPLEVYQELLGTQALCFVVCCVA